jgi:ribonuclease HI
MTVFVHTDGGSRGNPGPSACGVVIVHSQTDEVLLETRKFLGVGTNNEAEYQGLLFAIELLKEFAPANGVEKVIFRLDSNLVVQQMQGNWKVKDARMREYVVSAQATLRNAPYSWSIEYIPREKNSFADMQVNMALDAELI